VSRIFHDIKFAVAEQVNFPEARGAQVWKKLISKWRGVLCAKPVRALLAPKESKQAVCRTLIKLAI